MLGTALVRDNQILRGQTLIEKILRNGDSADARLLIGTTKLNAHDYRGAIEDLSTALELNPKLPDVHYFYGLALLSTGDTERAETAFEEELEVNPNNFDSRLQLGALLITDEKYVEAQQNLRRALQLRQGDLATRFQLAVLDIHQDRLESARTELEATGKGITDIYPGTRDAGDRLLSPGAQVRWGPRTGTGEEAECGEPAGAVRIIAALD